MINGVNDSDSHLNELISILRGSTIRVNLIPYNFHLSQHYLSSSEERMQYFKHNLMISGISASVRKSRGSDISAACGLLAAGALSRYPLPNLPPRGKE
jgi:23S rRNA (adenine2503-C2)-methyltransferase